MITENLNNKDIQELFNNFNLRYKVWIETIPGSKKDEPENIVGGGWSKLLQKIKDNKRGSLLEAAAAFKYSYKYAWSILKRIEERTGKTPVEIGKGGKGGGGWVQLNEWGEFLLNIYSSLKESLQEPFDNYVTALKNKMKKK